MVYQVAQAVSIPVVGLGGIASTDDALEFIMAGASAIQVGTALFVDPSLPLRIVEELAGFLEREGLSSIGELVGVANSHFKGGSSL